MHMENHMENTKNKQAESVLSIPAEQLTPGMRQYQEVKRQHPDCVVMLRMGDFYEMFYEDAITASRELEITLTARGKGEKQAPLAGVPYHALETYLGRLVKKGYKIAIVEQLEDPKQAKGLVKRGLVRIVTPGTVIESSLLDERENNYIMAITSTDTGFSLAASDLSTGEFFTTILPTEQDVLNEIARMQPKECLLPESLGVNQQLVQRLQASGCFLQPMEDYFFSLEKAKQAIFDHFSISSLESFGLQEQPASVKAAGALLHYLKETQKNSLSHLKTLSLRSNSTAMLLDSSTFRNLELVTNIRDGSSRGTLLSIMDKTVTALGGRLLKHWLKAPLLQRERIEQRLDAVGELKSQVILQEELRDVLQRTADLERLIGRVNYGTASPRDLLALKNTLQQLPQLREKIQQCRSLLLRTVAKIDPLQELAALLEAAVREDAPISVREGGMIKKEYHDELRRLQELAANSKQYLQALEQQEREKTGIPTLRISYNNIFGYYIEITKKNVHLVPPQYIRKQTTVNGERYITEELKQEEEKILGAQEKIEVLEYQLFQELVQRCAEKTEAIQKAASAIALLDVLCSLAKVALEQRYMRPQFVSENVLQITKGRHPVVEQKEPRFVANDVLLNPGEMLLITGPNMAGKSTILRQTALIVLLAQMGSFVPAEKAVLGIVDRIFTRVGASDDLAAGQSTFMVEMQETAAILHNATERSLLIIDEIGRGTSTFDGVAIAWSVAEHLHNQIKAKTLFTTHYHVLNKLAEKCPRIKTYNVAVKETAGEIIFLRKLIEGGTDKSYGVHVAKLAGLPQGVVQRAKEVQEILERDDDMLRKLQVKKMPEQVLLWKFGDEK